jgi:predicted nucleic acid-binding protein
MEKYTDIPMDLADGSLLVLAQNLHIKDIISIDSDYDIYRTIKKEALNNF